MGCSTPCAPKLGRISARQTHKSSGKDGQTCSPGGDAQQASAKRATMTMVALMGSMSFSWVAFNLPNPIERPCEQDHSPA